MGGVVSMKKKKKWYIQRLKCLLTLLYRAGLNWGHAIGILEKWRSCRVGFPHAKWCAR